MKCKRIQAFLSVFVDGELDQPRANQVRLHLNQCLSCRRVLDHLKLLVGETRRLEELQPPLGLFERVYAASQKTEPLSWYKRPMRVAIPIAATVALAIGLSTLFWKNGAAPKNDHTFASADIQLMESVAREYRRAEMHYQRAVGQLKQIAAEDSRQWPQRVKRAFLSNLKIIDDAVARCRGAAQMDPINPRAHDALFAAYRRQIDFLQNMILAGAPAPEATNAQPATWTPR